MRSLDKAQSVLKNHITNVKLQVLTRVKKTFAEQEWTEFRKK
jgi:hypothetical protein